MGLRLRLAQSCHKKNLDSHLYYFMLIIDYFNYYHAVFISSLMPHFEFSISSVCDWSSSAYPGIYRKPCRSHLNIPKLAVFDNKMNHLYSNSAISIFPLLILLRIWIISWRIHCLSVILSFYRLQMSLNFAYLLFLSPTFTCLYQSSSNPLLWVSIKRRRRRSNM